MEFKFFSQNGEMRPIGEAVVPLSNIEYQYGFGVYETVRVRNSIAYFLEQHIARFLESARIIGLQHSFDATLIERASQELIGRIEDETYNLKMLLIGGVEPQLSILPLKPHFPDKKLYREGAHCTTYEYVRPIPHAKTLNMFRSYLAYREAKATEAYDALLIDQSGNILEGTRTNFFCIKEKTLYSPPPERILLGVTRKIALKLAADLGYVVREKDMKLGKISEYDGAFLTSTSGGILPVASIDDHRFRARPESLMELMKAYDSFIEACGGKLN